MKPLIISPNDTILILAPHPDDDCIGCGGILSKFAAQTDVILLTDGRFGGTENPEEIAKIRKQEFEQAMKQAKVKSFKCLNISDRSLKDNFQTFKSIDFSTYTHIFIPHKNEDQRDHKVVYLFIMKSKISSNTIIAGYEVWTPLQNPNYFLGMDNFQPKKELISYYQSQLKQNDYISCTEGLNRYRGLRTGTKYAECYTLSYFGELQAKEHFWKRLFNIQNRIDGKKILYFLFLKIKL